MIEKIATKLVAYVSLVVLLLVTILTAFVTVDIASYLQYGTGFEVRMQPVTIIGVLLYVGLGAALAHLCKGRRLRLRWLVLVVFAYGVSVSFAWVLIANVGPAFDSLALIRAATLFSSQDSAGFEGYWVSGGYMDRFPFQLPLVLFMALCQTLTNSDAVFALELVNCLSIGTIASCIVYLTYVLWHRKDVALVGAFIVVGFTPLYLYSTFIYGNLPGLAFVLMAFIFQKRAVDESRYAFYGVISLVCMLVGVLFKQTYMIAAIALSLVWVVLAIGKKMPFALVIAFLTIAGPSLAMAPMASYAQGVTGLYLSQGVPKTAHIAMGIGASNEYYAEKSNNAQMAYDLRMPGFFDRYVLEFTDFDEYAKRDPELIKRRLHRYASNPQFAFEFFGKKLLLEWCEPTYEVLLNSNWETSHNSAPETNMAGREHNAIARNAYYGALHQFIVGFADVLQTVVVALAAVCVWANRKSFKIVQMCALICLLGAALLYLLWEAKAQYIYPYYLMIIPYSAYGMVFLANKLTVALEGISRT